MEIEKDFEAGPITLEEFEERADQYNQTLTEWKIEAVERARFMMNKKEFTTLKKKEILDLVYITTNELFNNDEQSHTIREIYQRAKALGLELCPPEVGPLKRLQERLQGGRGGVLPGGRDW